MVCEDCSRYMQVPEEPLLLDTQTASPGQLELGVQGSEQYRLSNSQPIQLLSLMLHCPPSGHSSPCTRHGGTQTAALLPTM